MSLRNLAVAIGFQIDAGPLARVDKEVDDFILKIGQIEGGIGSLGDQSESTAAGISNDFRDVGDSAESAGQQIKGAGADAEEAAKKNEDAIKSFGERAVEQLERVEKHWMKITLGAGLLGGGLEKMARTQAESTVQINRMSASLGIQSDQMRRLATETAEVGFPISDVLDLMETGRQQGIRSAKGLQEYAEFWGMVGDGAGESATQLADASAGLRAVGITAGRESEALGAMGYIVDNTTNSVSDLLAFLERTGPQLRTMGLGVDEAAAIMGALEHELGMTARLARTEFRKAVNDADGDLGVMLKTLGLSVDTFLDYRDAVDASSGVIERNAGFLGESYTWMQRIQHRVSELTFAYGPLIESLSVLSPLLIGLGPALKIVGGGIRGITSLLPVISTLAAKAGISMNLSFWPVTLTILGVVAAVLLVQDVLTYLRGEGDSLTGRVVAWIGTWDEWSMTAKVGAGILGGALLVGLGLATKAVIGFSAALWANPIGLVIAGIVALGAAIFYLVTRWDDISEWTRGLWGSITSSVSNGVDSVVDWFKTLPDRTMATLTGWRDDIKGWFASKFNLGGMLSNAIESALDTLPAPLRSVADKIMGFFPQSPAKEGPLLGLDRVGPGFVEEIRKGIDGVDLTELDAAVGDVAMSLRPDVADIDLPTYSGVLGLTPDVDWSGHDLAFMGSQITPTKAVSPAENDVGERRWLSPRPRGSAVPEINLSISVDARGATAKDAESIGKTTAQEVREVVEDMIKQAFLSEVVEEV